MKPILTEPGVTYFIEQTLKQYYAIRMKHQYMIFNAFLCVSLIFIVGGFLYCRFKGRPSPEEMEEKELQKKHYIMSKIRNYQQARRQMQDQLITGLPHWESEVDLLHENGMRRMMNELPSFVP